MPPTTACSCRGPGILRGLYALPDLAHV